MTENLMKLDYFYGQEAEQFTFIMMPKSLFTDPYYAEVSNEAKIVYALMLERLKLSIANGWFDENNRPYIYYKAKQIMKDLHCQTQKCAKLVSELEARGLIRKEKQGIGMPDRIYVMNFATMLDQEKDMRPTEDDTEDEDFEDEERGIPDIPESNHRRFENPTSTDVKNKSQEIRKSKPNNTKINNTEFNNTNLINHISEDSEKPTPADEIDKIDEMVHTIRENLEYDFYAAHKDNDSRQYCELCSLVFDTVRVNRQTIRIDKADVPVSMVRDRFLKLTPGCIRYVQLCLGETTTRIGNIKNYLLTALYHAPETQSVYFEQRVRREQF